MSANLDRLLAAWPEDAASVRRLCGAVRDWPALLDEAARHGVDGIIRHACAASGVALPPEVEPLVERRRAAEALWQSAVADATDAVLGALDAAGVRAVALKGPVLAERLYPDPSVRLSTDVDVLVVPADLERACDALAALGYTPEAGPADRYHRRHHHHIHLAGTRPPVVELHFRAYAGFGVIMPAEAWVEQAAEYRTRRGLRTWVLAPPDELLYLAVHAAGHCFERLLWLYDLKLFLRRQAAVDWPDTARAARRLGVASALALTCDLLRERLAVAVPEADGLTLRDGARTRLIRRLVAAAEQHPGPSLAATAVRLTCMACLCDGVTATAWFLQHHTWRIIRRRARRSLPALTPERWSA